MRSSPNSIILHTNYPKPTFLPKPNRPGQKRMSMQVKALNALPFRIFLQRLKQSSRYPAAPILRQHIQPYNLHSFQPAIVQMRKAMVVRHVADCSY